MVAYRVRFKTMFMGKWIKHSSLYPTWVVRLMRPSRVSFRRKTNLEYLTDGEVGRLREHLLHYTFHKGMEAWFEKHNRYSSGEALEAEEHLQSGSIDWMGLVGRGDEVRRRKALKELSFRFPFRPSLRFAYMYLLRGGYLDGRAGFDYCRLLAMYEFMIAIKRREARRRFLGLWD
jgi:hypothetical protein